MITTKELAKLAGVSQSTVSKSLNDSYEISPETKARIRKLAKENGYIIKKKKSGTIATSERRNIAVIMGNFQLIDTYLRLLYNALIEQIVQENYFPMLIFCDRTNMLDRIKELYSSEMVDGYIILNRLYSQDVERYLAEKLAPHIYLHYYDRYCTDAISIVDTDNNLGGYLAGQHLISLGHTKIATLACDGDEYTERTTGFLSALKSQNLDRAHAVFKVGRGYKAGYEFATSHKDLLAGYTAIFAQTEPTAIGLINALTDMGIKVPDDISVIGYDGCEIGHYCRPELTTLLQPVDQLSSIAVNTLLQSMALKGDALIKTQVQPQLIVRSSTGPVKKSEVSDE